MALNPLNRNNLEHLAMKGLGQILKSFFICVSLMRLTLELLCFEFFVLLLYCVFSVHAT